MLPQTTLEMKAPSLLCAVHTPGYNLAMLHSISRVHVNGLQLLTFQKEGIIQYVPFLFYTGTLHPILVQTLSLFVTNQIKTTQTVWQVPQWAVDMTSFDFTRDLYHRRLRCFNRHNFNWSCFILWMMYLSLPLADLCITLKHSLTCYLHLSLAKAQYFKFPSFKLAWKKFRRWEEEIKAPTWNQAGSCSAILSQVT